MCDTYALIYNLHLCRRVFDRGGGKPLDLVLEPPHVCLLTCPIRAHVFSSFFLFLESQRPVLFGSADSLERSISPGWHPCRSNVLGSVDCAPVVGVISVSIITYPDNYRFVKLYFLFAHHHLVCDEVVNVFLFLLLTTPHRTRKYNDA